jgi:glutaredoxin-like YruB-family protein
MVKVYITPTCPYCVTLKEYLKEHNIDFEEVDISQNEEARDDIIKRSGQMGTPIVEVDGNIVAGFDKEKINQLLKIKA